MFKGLTKEKLQEAAYFNPKGVLRLGRFLGIHNMSMEVTIILIVKRQYSGRF